MKKRIILDKLLTHLSKKAYTILIGARQTGKTTLLKHLFEISKSNLEVCYFLTFENNLVLDAINEHPENIFRFVEKVFVKQPNKRLVLFIDEIQYASNATNFLKYLYDTYEGQLKIVATGSSAFYIDQNFNDSLAGRKRIFHLRHLSFEEYLFFQDADDLQNELAIIRKSGDYISIKRNELNYFFEEYLCYGGYPAVSLKKDRDEKIEMLRELKNSYLKKDFNEAGIVLEQKFIQLMMILSVQIGGLVNKNELANTIGIDNKTVDNYLNIMKKSFHINLVYPYFNNMRKEITKMPKVFFNDFGMRNALLNNFDNFIQRNDKGELLENYFYIRLTEIYDEDSIYFWRTSNQHEVDFVVKQSFNNYLAFEIKTSSSSVKKSKYRHFTELYPNIPLSFVTYRSDNLNSNSKMLDILCI